MPELLAKELFGATVQNWLLALAAALAVTGLLALIRRLATRDEKEQADLKSKLHKQQDEARQRFREVRTNMLAHTRKTSVFVVAIYFSMRAFNIAEGAVPYARHITVIVALMQLGWWAEGLVSRWFAMEDQRHTPRGARSLARGLIWIVVVLVALDSLGLDVSTAITGLGITGVAVALSTRQILSDLFAFFSITTDKPFERGDFIVVDDCMGNVEDIGLRSTRIRSLSGEQIVFANSVLMDKRIQNYKTLKARRIESHLRVVYQTPYEKLSAIPDLIAEVFGSIDLTNFDRAHFSDYGESSLEIEFVYYVMTSDYNKYMDIRQQIHLAIFEKFEEQGIEFAYPTQTLLLDDVRRTDDA